MASTRRSYHLIVLVILALLGGMAISLVVAQAGNGGPQVASGSSAPAGGQLFASTGHMGVPDLFIDPITGSTAEALVRDVGAATAYDPLGDRLLFVHNDQL